MPPAQLIQALRQAQAAFAIEEAGRVDAAVAQRRQDAARALEEALAAADLQSADLEALGPMIRDLAFKSRYHVRWGSIFTQWAGSAAPVQAKAAPEAARKKIDIVF